MQFLGVTIRSVLIIVALKNVCECNEIVETPLQTGVRYPELQNDSFEMYQDGTKRTIYIRTNDHYYHLELEPSHSKLVDTVAVCWDVYMRERKCCKHLFEASDYQFEEPTPSYGHTQLNQIDRTSALVRVVNKRFAKASSRRYGSRSRFFVKTYSDHFHDKDRYPPLLCGSKEIHAEGGAIIVDMDNTELGGRYHVELKRLDNGSCSVEMCVKVIQGFFPTVEKDCRNKFRSPDYIFKQTGFSKNISTRLVEVAKEAFLEQAVERCEVPTPASRTRKSLRCSFM